MSESTSLFATLTPGGRVWAVGAVHGEAERLMRLHAALWPRLREGDAVVYLGNHLGRGARVREAVDELLVFRRRLLAGGIPAEAVVFLRGGQEEMWHKLLQLQFAPNPREVLAWMLEQGVGATLEAYGGSAEEGMGAAREGAVALTRWTGRLRQAMRARDGHVQIQAALKHAALTEDNALLFVHAGVDPSRPLSAQSDSFWWGGGGFSAMSEPYGDFRRVVRGYDRRHGGARVDAYTATVDGGCGFGGSLLAYCFEPGGKVVETVEA